VTDPAEPHGDFVAAFESAFARFQVRVEEACAREPEWPRAVAAGVRATFEFAAAEPTDADILTNGALAQGRLGADRHRKLVVYAARLLEPGRAARADSPPPPAVLERALAGGIAFLIGHRLAQGKEAELPGLAAEAIEFVLTPYLGADEARRIARA
jgi:hypothetical protein